MLRILTIYGLVNLLALAATSQDTQSSSASPALHARIDAAVEQAAIGPLAPLCNDAEYIRRLYLDLTGGVPTAEEVSQFLENRSQDKREALVDRLLASADFVRHMAVELDVILLERRTETAIAVPEWESYLLDSVAKRKPLDQLYQELIFFEPDPVAAVPPSKFLLCRTAEPNALTRDVGRLAFGMDLQCAQCHDHPLISDYLQDDYYGLYAFWHRTSLFTDPKSKAISIRELAEGETSFESVFTGDGRAAALPHAPLGGVLVDEPVLLKADAYDGKQDGDRPARPKYSRRQRLAQQLSENVAFRRNVANRLWQKMFGRGLVHPLDFHHSENPPIHPQLLSLLADELGKQGFTLRPMLKELALTRAYQRSSAAPDPACVNFKDIAARKLQLQAEHDHLAQVLLAARESLHEPQEVYHRLLRQQEQAAAELPKLLKAANEAHETHLQSREKLDQRQSEYDRLSEQFSTIRAAADACRQAARLATEDSSLTTIFRQLEAKANQFALRRTAARTELRSAQEEFSKASATFNQAQAALTSADRRQLSNEDMAVAERDYRAARMELEQAHYEQQAVASSIKLCELAAQFEAVRKHDAAQAESLWQNLLQNWTQRQQLGAVRPLSAEQLLVAMLQVTGNWTAQVRAAREKLATEPPSALKQAAPEEKQGLEERLLQLALLEQVRGKLKQFVALFGTAPGEDFQATVNQALFVGNSAVVDELLKPRASNLSQRLLRLTDAGQLADALYLAILSRPATLEERREIMDRFANNGESREALLREMQWALLASAEFRFNY